ncbi:TPA: nucleotidyl transferase AbiEii/AbiGii toxin family protein [Candidatus Acetothermia bacterium]|nr:nucleotidyl transferase AbiEii/AbiGii toxin family protein [Candidatus Acetothermia bacterium]
MSRTEGLAHSVHVRLVARAKKLGIEAQMMLERFALQRLLYRLSKSAHAERFVLKGAQLMLLWMGETVRPTRDADLLGLGDLSDDSLIRIFRGLCTLDVEPDGMEYLTETVQVASIRRENVYGGRRVTLKACLGNARLHLQVDVGIGDAITPDPDWVELPSLLDFPSPRLLGYPPETSIAEKVETMVARGLLNSRLRDYFDIFILAERKAFDGAVLTAAVRHTFERRGTSIPDDLPPGLLAKFAEEPGKQTQWESFHRKFDDPSVPEDLASVVERIALFVGPVLRAARGNDRFDRTWPPGGPWQTG